MLLEHHALPTGPGPWCVQTSLVPVPGRWVETRMQRGRVPLGAGLRVSGAVLGGFHDTVLPMSDI